MCALSLLPNFAINLEISSCLGDKVGAWFAANQIRKTYLARVKGSFKKLLETEIAGVFRAKKKTPVEGSACEVVLFFAKDQQTEVYRT